MENFVTIYENTEIYLNKILRKPLLELLRLDYPKVYDYVQTLVEKFELAVQKINKSNFWEVFSEILGYDSRFVILNSLELSTEVMAECDIIAMMERDYVYLNKEFYGYLLNEEQHESIIFNVK